MANAKAKRLSDLRASLGTLCEIIQNDDSDEIEDPISAYFKQRCGDSSKTLFKKQRESDSESSVGLIDVDNVSLFGDEENENKNFRYSAHSLDKVNKESSIYKKNKNETDVSTESILEIENELDRQRTLAQKALKGLCNKSQNDTTILTPDKRESKALSDISSKLMNVKLSVGNGLEKEWFQPNLSPNTPRYFNDELSSFGGEDETRLIKSEHNIQKDVGKNRQSQYAKKVNSMLKELHSVNYDIEFETQTEEEQIKKFEEDEKKFKLENSGVLHNSQISQFSGIDGEMSKWPLEAPDVNSDAHKNLSIGQFFNLRSNRVSSLVGSVSANSVPTLEQSQSLTENQTYHHSKSECSFPITEASHQEQPKVRRCVSTLDLKRTPEITKSMRGSSESCSSHSSLMIQDIIAEMESGLSGTQIYEKLIKSYGRREKEKGERKKVDKSEKLKKNFEHNETPKSSKTSQRKAGRTNEKEQSVGELRKELKTLSCADSITPNSKKTKAVSNSKLNDTMPLDKFEKIKKLNSKGFCASTPKTQNSKCQNDKFKTDCGKVLMKSEDWEAPKVKSIQPIDLNRSEGSDDNEKTITVSSTNVSVDQNKKYNTVTINDTLTIEDTIVAGDLTVISQRIDEMKRDSVCIVRPAEPKEPVLLTVIQKLADLPKGTLDCTALTPLLRDQFPELLSTFPTPSGDSTMVNFPKANIKEQDSLVAHGDSWVKLPEVWGQKEKVFSCADLEKSVLVPIANISKNWVLISLESLDLIHPQGKKLPCVKKNNELSVLDFVVVSLKETIIPPDHRQFLKIFFRSKVATKLEIMLIFNVKELMNGEVQSRQLRLIINNVHPENYLNVLPKDMINFGTIADQCFDQQVVQVSFDGICELPLTVYVEENESVSGHFILKPCSGFQNEKEWEDNIFHHVFSEGEKQVLEFRVIFRPNVLLKEDSQTQDFIASLVLMLGSKTETDGILRKIPLKGSVGFAKFLCSPSCTPLVIRAQERGQTVSRAYLLKNVGSLPIALSVSLMNEEREVIEGDDVFVVPKSFYLSRNEESGINVTFNARCQQNFIKRYLKLQMKPNGRVIYEAEVIGIISSSERGPVSRPSSGSVSTKSVTSSESASLKLLTTSHSLSWSAVSLEKEVRQTFQIKCLSSVTISVRITFERNLGSFKLVNENGEKVHKLRKVLKPGVPIALTVAFRPDVVGAHNTALMFETSHSCWRKKILLNGIGGTPNLVMRNVKSDLNGSKILRLQHNRSTNQFESLINFTNEGRIPAFLLIKLGVKDFSLSHDLNIFPSSVIIYPDSSIPIKISQKLKSSDLQQLLYDREIRKIATICVLTGDEPSRLRIKKLVDTGKLEASERLKIFTGPFQDEKEMQLKNFKDPPGFETEFLKSLKVHEIAVVIEKSAEICEPSILEETTDEFISFMSYNTVVSTAKSQKPTVAESYQSRQKPSISNTLDVNETIFSADSLKSVSSHKRVTKWLETLDCS